MLISYLLWETDADGLFHSTVYQRFVGIDYDPNVPTVRKLAMSVASIAVLFYDYVLTFGEEVCLPGPIRFVFT